MYNLLRFVSFDRITQSQVIFGFALFFLYDSVKPYSKIAETLCAMSAYKSRKVRHNKYIKRNKYKKKSEVDEYV